MLFSSLHIVPKRQQRDMRYLLYNIYTEEYDKQNILNNNNTYTLYQQLPWVDRLPGRHTNIFNIKQSASNVINKQHCSRANNDGTQ